MPQFLLLPGASSETVKSQDNQKTVNWYMEIDDSGLGQGAPGGKYPVILRPTPGLKPFAAIGSGVGEIRALFDHRDVLYVVANNTFYSVGTDGTETVKGTLSSFSGVVQIAASNSQIMIVDGTIGYVYNVDTDIFQTITDTDFTSTPDDVTYQDGFFVVVSQTDHKFYLSSINEALDWQALDFASATSHPDKLIGVTSDHRELWLFGTKTTEVWFNSGNATFPFERRPGVLISKGLAARDSLVQTDNSLFWLARDEQGESTVVRASGYTPQVISSVAVSQAIDSYDTVSDAVAFSYREGKHEFYVISFPTANKTWVYDISTNQWHERDSYDGGDYNRYRAQVYAYSNGKHIVGDYSSRNLYELDDKTYTDNGELIRRMRRTKNYQANNNLSSMYNLVIDFEPGVGLDAGQGSDPQVMLRVSKDGGHTFGNEMMRDIGAAGVYNRRAKWDMLGSARVWSLEITVTDPVNAVLLGGYADIEPGDA